MMLYSVLRDREVRVEVDMARAEPDVGIMSAYVDDYTVTDGETGEQLNWELSDTELNQLAEQADEQAMENAYDHFYEED